MGNQKNYDKLLEAINSNAPFWEIKNKTETSADMFIYSSISRWGKIWGETSAKDIVDAIQGLGKIATLNVHINSPGGSVTEGLAIKSFLSQQAFDKHVYIDGLCASIATVIAFGIGATVHMSDTSLVMIHNAWGNASGEANELRKAADVLEKHNDQIKKVYVARSNLSEDQITEKMDAESWLDASECLKIGFIDDIIYDSVDAAACVPQAFYDAYTNAPERLKVISEKQEESGLDAEMKAVIDKANRALADYEQSRK